MLKSIHKIVIGILILLISTSSIFAQWGEGPGKGPKAKEKISMIKKMKLLEILDLDEKTSEKFLAKYTTWENKIQDKMAIVNNSIDDLEKSVQASDSKEVIVQKTTKVQQEQRDFSNLLFQSQEDIKTMLNEIQFAKFVIFEHKFKEELQKMIMKRMRGKDRD